MFNSERPIENPGEDLLGRSTFAETLGDAILQYKDKESLVVGLYGEWGSGKTSIINMALHSIREKSKGSDSQPVILRFNPWNFSNQNQLVLQFFNQLSLKMEISHQLPNAKEISKSVDTFGGALFEPVNFMGRITKRFAPKEVVEQEEGKPEEGSPPTGDLETLKTDLDTKLGANNNKVIIIIDDIDRLSDVEIRQVFQLVKSLGDFKNTIYLLSLDKEIVSRALSKDQDGRGLEYMEKIIQVPFDVPQISQESVEAILFKGLDDLLNSGPSVHFDDTYWREVYNNGLKKLFRDLRGVRRFLNTAKINYYILAKEANPVDVFAVSALQVFAPNIYSAVRDNRNLLAGSLDSLERLKELKKEDKKERFEAILSKGEDRFKEPLRDLLLKLFPRIETLYKNVGYDDSYHAAWKKQGRVCSPFNFDLYFRLSFPKGMFSRAEIQDVLRALDDLTQTKEMIRDFIEQGRIKPFLDKTEEFLDKISEKSDIQNLSSALIHFTDSMLKKGSGFGSRDPVWETVYIISNLLKSLPSTTERNEVISNIISELEEGLFGAIFLVAQLDDQHGRYTSVNSVVPENDRLVTAAQLDELEKLGLEKIRLWAAEGRLLDNKNLLFILYRWKEWAGSEEVKRFTSEMLRRPSGLNCIASGFISQYSVRGLNEILNPLEFREELASIVNRMQEANIDGDELTQYPKLISNIDSLIQSIEAEARVSAEQR